MTTPRGANTSAQQKVSVSDQETGSLAREMAAAYRQMATFYHDQLHFPSSDADKQARGLDYSVEEAEADRQRIFERPADQVSWFDLTRLAERNPDDAGAAWTRVRREALHELASGHRTAQALEWQGGPWQRARFLAIRDTFRADTPPHSGIESALLDTSAEAFGDYLEWSEQLHMQVSSEMASERTSLERHGEWSPVRLSNAEAIDLSSRMAERAHNRFLRSIKMLHDLQRTRSTVFIGNATQINVGRQQVNVAASPGGTTEIQDLPK